MLVARIHVAVACNHHPIVNKTRRKPCQTKDKRVIVIGIEIDYTTMAEQVESLRLYGNGYAFLCDAKGELFFHPRIDVTHLTPETLPDIPEGVLSDSTFFRYTFEGVKKQGA